MTDTMEILCLRCGNQWNYTGKKLKTRKKYAQFVCCTQCGTSVKVEEVARTLLKQKIKEEIREEIKKLGPLKN